MTTNADMTIYNQHLNAELKEVEYISTKITGVHWYANLKATVGEKGLQSAEVYKIRIPADADTEGREYIEPRKYRHLSAGEVVNYWTIQKGDLFGKGITEMTVDELKRSQDFSVVLSIGDNRRGLESHFRIGARDGNKR